MAEGSMDVFINGRPACRKDDKVTTHLRPGNPCPAHAPGVARGSVSVFINGRPAARVGDPITSCTSIAEGSPDVIIGG